MQLLGVRETATRLGIFSLSFMLFSGFATVAFAQQGSQGVDRTSAVSDSAGSSSSSTSSSLHRMGVEYLLQTQSEQRHSDHLLLRPSLEQPYLADLNYAMNAQGSAVNLTDNTSSSMRVTLNLSTWMSTKSLVWMDVMGGSVQVADREFNVRAGNAYYLVGAHQVRVTAFVTEDGSGTKSFQILVLKAKAGPGSLPSPNNSTEPLPLQVLGSQSRLMPGWQAKLDGEIKLLTSSSSPPAQPKDGSREVVLTVILDQGSKDIFHSLIELGLQRLKENHPDLDIRVDEKYFEYPGEKNALNEYAANGTSIDLFSADQIWLGELAEKGLLADLTNYTKNWGRGSEWYQTNWDGGGYKGKTYGIWVWTDVRGIYYWKDMLDDAGVDPESLRTWDGYISAAKQLNAELRPEGIEGVHLTGASHSPDLWYPYLWMLGGEILEQKAGNPMHGQYWFPAYNSSAGVKALTFLKDQVDAGIIPQKNHYWGKEFEERKFAVMIEASHVPSYFQPMTVEELDSKVGYLPLLPVPNATSQTATLMGGWELTIPQTSRNKELAWELISHIVEPDVLAPQLAKYNYLPTQLPIGQGSYSQELRKANPFFDEMASLIQYGHGRPSIPEYPQIAEHIREAIDDVYYGRKDPKQALDDAAAKSAEVLGWVG